MIGTHHLDVLHALVDLRAIARGNEGDIRMWVERPERRAPRQVAVSVRFSGSGITGYLRRGDNAVSLIRSLVRTLERMNVTARRYEDDLP